MKLIKTINVILAGGTTCWFILWFTLKCVDYCYNNEMTHIISHIANVSFSISVVVEALFAVFSICIAAMVYIYSDDGKENKNE